MFIMDTYTQEQTRTLDQTKAYIDTIDFSMIINKMVSHQGWSKKHAEQACQQYRRFLFLNKKYVDLRPLPPSEEVDEFWHHHILDTKKYIKDCQIIFGEYFNHYPYLVLDGKSNADDLVHYFQKTQECYFKEYHD